MSLETTPDQMETPVWHYGLIARWWAEFNTEGPEIDYFRSMIGEYGQPALDAACGTGRLLLPYLRLGLDVDGCDISADMLALCRAKAEAEGLKPHLYEQALRDLNLPRKYKTIVVCGALGLGNTRAQDQQALVRFFDHLLPGGCLLVDSYLPYQDPEEWRAWLPEERHKLPAPWPSTWRRKRAANGEEIEIRTRIAAVDPLDQTLTREIQAQLWNGDQLIRREEYSLLERAYFRNEVLDMLSLAGFRQVQVLADYTKEPPTADSRILIYVARK